MRTLAALVLLAGVMANNIWKLYPPSIQAEVWNASGALFNAALLLFIGLLAWSKWMWPVVALLMGFSLQTAVCSIAYIISPWHVEPGAELCSSGIQLPLGMMGLWAAICVATIIQGKSHGKPKP